MTIDTRRIDAVLEEAVESGKVPHVAAIAADRDGVVYEGGAGVRITGESDEPVSTSVVASSSAAQTAVDTAMAQRGKPYVWAAEGPGSYDCSGLMLYAYRAAGIGLPHSSLMQSQMGSRVSRSELRPGDLVFFYSPVSHVAMYIGDGLIVSAPHTGDVVKVIDLDYMPEYAGARRIA